MRKRDATRDEEPDLGDKWVVVKLATKGSDNTAIKQTAPWLSDEFITLLAQKARRLQKRGNSFEDFDKLVSSFQFPQEGASDKERPPKKQKEATKENEKAKMASATALQLAALMASFHVRVDPEIGSDGLDICWSYPPGCARDNAVQIAVFDAELGWGSPDLPIPIDLTTQEALGVALDRKFIKDNSEAGVVRWAGGSIKSFADGCYVFALVDNADIARAVSQIVTIRKGRIGSVKGKPRTSVPMESLSRTPRGCAQGSGVYIGLPKQLTEQKKATKSPAEQKKAAKSPTEKKKATKSPLCPFVRPHTQDPQLTGNPTSLTTHQPCGASRSS